MVQTNTQNKIQQNTENIGLLYILLIKTINFDFGCFMFLPLIVFILYSNSFVVYGLNKKCTITI
jgi:hypothetical protein